MQAARGHSLYLVELKETGVSVGMSGLIKRDGLDDVDLGYAFLPPYFGMGYGYEAALAVRDHARDVVGLEAAGGHHLARERGLERLAGKARHALPRKSST
ncbi:GNAT family N-acetyltransferase [Massilia sp. H-1]|nr:GNAT family N-acetyltransferase [Massilia sp. H-1]